MASISGSFLVSQMNTQNNPGAEVRTTDVSKFRVNTESRLGSLCLSIALSNIPAAAFGRSSSDRSTFSANVLHPQPLTQPLIPVSHTSSQRSWDPMRIENLLSKEDSQYCGPIELAGAKPTDVKPIEGNGEGGQKETATKKTLCPDLFGKLTLFSSKESLLPVKYPLGGDIHSLLQENRLEEAIQFINSTFPKDSYDFTDRMNAVMTLKDLSEKKYELAEGRVNVITGNYKIIVIKHILSGYVNAKLFDKATEFIWRLKKEDLLGTAFYEILKQCCIHSKGNCKLIVKIVEQYEFPMLLMSDVFREFLKLNDYSFAHSLALWPQDIIKSWDKLTKLVALMYNNNYREQAIALANKFRGSFLQRRAFKAMIEDSESFNGRRYPSNYNIFEEAKKLALQIKKDQVRSFFISYFCKNCKGKVSYQDNLAFAETVPISETKRSLIDSLNRFYNVQPIPAAVSYQSQPSNVFGGIKRSGPEVLWDPIPRKIRCEDWPI